MQLFKKETVRFSIPSTLEAFESFFAKKGIGENAEKGNYRGWYEHSNFEFHHKFSLLFANVSEKQDYYIYKGHAVEESGQLHIEVEIGIRYAYFMLRNFMLPTIIACIVLRDHIGEIFGGEFELSTARIIFIAFVPLIFFTGILFARINQNKAIKNLRKYWEAKIPSKQLSPSIATQHPTPEE